MIQTQFFKSVGKKLQTFGRRHHAKRPVDHDRPRFHHRSPYQLDQKGRPVAQLRMVHVGLLFQSQTSQSLHCRIHGTVFGKGTVHILDQDDIVQYMQVRQKRGTRRYRKNIGPCGIDVKRAILGLVALKKFYTNLMNDNTSITKIATKSFTLPCNTAIGIAL